MKSLILYLILILFSCNSNKQDKYFELIEHNDQKLDKPVEGDWLFSHKEKGQSLEEFTNSNPVKPTDKSNIIYLRPIGTFNSLQKKQIELLREYLEIYFQLKTQTLDSISNDVVPNSARRFIYNEQLLAGYILDTVLTKNIPVNGIALMGITELDLFPKPEWNYVFGLASYTKRIGVSSFYRLQDEELNEKNFDICLARLIKVSSHEIGHMFGLHHCINATCVMNGSNNLPETDRAPIRLCSLCQRKINSSLGYDNHKRLIDLAGFLKRNKLYKEFELMEKDLRSIE
jgi:archaemetzincin